MNKKLSIVICFLLAFTSLFTAETSYADDSCRGIAYGQKIYWDGSELKPGQIGRVSIVKDTYLYKLSGENLMKGKILKAGTSYRIYNFKTNLLGVGGGYYINRDNKITYKTPSKEKLQASACASKKPSANNPAPPAEKPVVIDHSCTGIVPGQKIKWDDTYLVPGQIGRVFIIKDTSLYKLTSSGLKHEKTLKKGSSYRIYNFKTGLLGVGGGYYVKRDERITYKTPSKKKLQDLACASRKSPTEQSKVPLHNKKPVNLGPQVFNQSTIAAKSGMDKMGNAYLYVILHGTPTSLAVVDLNTNDVIGEYKLVDSTSAWGLDIDSTGTLWVAGTNSGTLYSYDPIFRKLINHGHVLKGTNDTSIQDIFVNDQYVYGVTAYGANVFKYNKKTKNRDFILPTQKHKQYAKSLVVDKDNKNLYVSSGSKAEMVQWNLSNHSKISILPDKYKNETYVEKMKLIDNRYLLTKFYPSKKAGIYDIISKKYINEFNSASRGFSEKNNELNEFYYSYEGKLYAYHLGSGTVRDTNAALPENTEALSLDLVRLKDGTRLLVGLVDNKGTYFLFNPKTNELILKKFEAPPQPVNLHLMFESPDQKHLYINGYMSGGLTQFDTLEKKGIQLNGISQLESAQFVNGKLYVSAYPNARLTEINNPELPWDQRSTSVLVRLKDYGQERIPALISVNNHLFAGTYPQFTTSGGLLLDYDLNTKTYKVYENYINNQSIITLHPHGGLIYGGTSVHANYQKDKDGAKFFKFNPANPGQKQIIQLPLKASLVMSLMTGPDKNIWGAADGTIFSYNPSKNQFRTVKMLPAISGRYGNANLLVGKDGYIYGTLEGRFFKMDPKTMNYALILESGAKEIAQDSFGNIYYRHLSNLYMYPIK